MGKKKKKKNSLSFGKLRGPLCTLLIRICILSTSCNYLMTFFFFHMPNLCSYLSDNQIENLPPGVFTNNTELTEL